MIDKYKALFEKTNNIERSSYIWNTIAGLIVSIQSAIMLIVITRTNGLEDAGVFSIAFAISSLMPCNPLRITPTRNRSWQQNLFRATYQIGMLS